MESRIHRIKVLQVVLIIYCLYCSSVQFTDKLVKELYLLVFIGIRIGENFFYTGRFVLCNVQCRGQSHRVLCFSQIIIKDYVVVQLLNTIEIRFHHHSGNILFWRYRDQNKTSNTSNNYCSSNYNNVLLNKKKK